MKRKATNTFTEEEKEWMNTVAANYILAQSDGFQLGYGTAIRDFTEYITDYWEGSDDKPQESVLNVLVDLGVELGKRQSIAKRNVEEVEKNGYEQYYNWEYKEAEKPFRTIVKLFTKKDAEEDEE